MAPRKNLSRLAHEDCTASNGHWWSETIYEAQVACFVRNIYRYGTLMMTLQLDPGTDKFEVIVTNPAFDAILYEREGGSMSDKCGLSRIRQSLLLHNR